jgi:hypothetical protein
VGGDRVVAREVYPGTGGSQGQVGLHETGRHEGEEGKDKGTEAADASMKWELEQEYELERQLRSLEQNKRWETAGRNLDRGARLRFGELVPARPVIGKCRRMKSVRSAQWKEVLRSFDRILEAPEELLEVGTALDEIDVRSVDHQ